LSKKTLNQIIVGGNDYVVKVKRNQKRLASDLKFIYEHHKAESQHKTNEKNRGRKEIRIINKYSLPEAIKLEWQGSKTLIHISRETIRKGRKSITHSYYLSSLTSRIEVLSKGIRSHWDIENRLHYVKDVSLHEDASKIKKGNAPSIFSLIRNLVISIARLNGENRIKKFIRLCNGDLFKIKKYLE
jgi:predicted transposase YbfD/YdcC